MRNSDDPTAISELLTLWTLTVEQERELAGLDTKGREKRLHELGVARLEKNRLSERSARREGIRR